MNKTQRQKCAHAIDQAARNWLKGAYEDPDDKELLDLYKADAKELRAIAKLLRQGKEEKAAEKVMDLDTIVRDEIPSDVYDALVNVLEGGSDEFEEGIEPSGWQRHDRYASQEFVQGAKKDKRPGYYDVEDDEGEEPSDYFSHQRKKTMKEGYVKQLRYLLETEVEQAESLIAAKSFSQELQDMIEKLGRLINEDLPAVSEQMRDSYGADVATGFENTVSDTLSGIMDTLRQSKQEIDNSVSSIANGGTPEASVDMDNYGPEAEEKGGEEPDLDLDKDVDLDLDNEEGEAPELPEVPEEPLGRAKKESTHTKGEPMNERQLRSIRAKIVEMQQALRQMKLDEKWKGSHKTNPKNEGKWAKYTVAELRSKRNALKKKKHRTKAETSKLRQINYAIRAKTNWGKVSEEAELSEKWKNAKKGPSHPGDVGKWAPYSVAELHKKRNALKKKEHHTKEDTKKLREINYAIRAKTDWGKVDK